MTEEQNFEVKEEKCNCLCKSEYFRKFLIVTFGSFFGVFFALTLFAALHRPPVPPMPMHGYDMRPPMHRHCDCDCHRRGPHGEFHKKFVPPVEDRAPITPERRVRK